MAPPPNLHGFPTDLKTQRRWVAWRYVTRRGKTTKQPMLSITEPGTWLSVTQACDLVACGKADGVGFVLGDGLVGIDLDDCIDPDGTLHEMAQHAIRLGTYVERSPSGRGLHALIRARISEPRNIAARRDIPRHEIYDGRKGSARYLTVTGDHVGDALGILEGSAAQRALDAFYAKWFSEDQRRAAQSDVATNDLKPLEDDEVLRIMSEAADGAKWRRLFDGDHSGYPPQSEADLALLRKLRFYSRADRAQMDRLFRRSGLMRRKWDERRGEQTYGQLTTGKALAAGGRLYRVPVTRYSGGTSRSQFGKVHRSVLPLLAHLTKTDILTYLASVLHANSKGECYPSATGIAALIGTTREHAQNSLTNLGVAGLVSPEKRPGKTSILRFPAFRDVSNLDTRPAMERKASKLPKPTSIVRRPKLARRSLPVSELDTPPASNFDTRTDKEQSIDTGEGEAGASEDEKPNQSLRKRTSLSRNHASLLAPALAFYVMRCCAARSVNSSSVMGRAKLCCFREGHAESCSMQTPLTLKPTFAAPSRSISRGARSARLQNDPVAGVS